MQLKVVYELTAIVIAVIIRCESVSPKTSTGYVTMAFTPYRKNSRTIGIGGYLNSSPRRPRRHRNRLRPLLSGHHHNDHHSDNYPEPYEDDYYDNHSSGSDRCNCKTKYVAIEVPKGSRKSKNRYRYRESQQQEYIAVPVETVSMNDGSDEDRAADKSEINEVVDEEKSKTDDK